ncbi:hypothetical protein MMC29_000197 [Sticta canariensis]|nr:hypothetical protein [Sticta canariensis]
MTSVKRFVAAAKIEEVRVSIGTEGIGSCQAAFPGAFTSQASRACTSHTLPAYRIECGINKMWREVVDSMALTPDQRGSIVELWHSFHAQLPPVVDARRDLHAAIAATIPSGLEARELAIQYVKADELMEALKKNLRQEHVLIHEFLLNFYEQMARCVVKAFPYYPDIPAITLWIAADHGIQDAAQALKKLSSRAPTVRVILVLVCSLHMVFQRKICHLNEISDRVLSGSVLGIAPSLGEQTPDARSAVTESEPSPRALYRQDYQSENEMPERIEKQGANVQGTSAGKVACKVAISSADNSCKALEISRRRLSSLGQRAGSANGAAIPGALAWPSR